MIPKAQILELSRNFGLLPTTVEKDYVLGWLLREISVHKELSKNGFLKEVHVLRNAILKHIGFQKI